MPGCKATTVLLYSAMILHVARADIPDFLSYTLIGAWVAVMTVFFIFYAKEPSPDLKRSGEKSHEYAANQIPFEYV